MTSSTVILFFLLQVISFTEGADTIKTEQTNPQQSQSRQALGSNLVDPYYGFNPDYMGGNMPGISLYQPGPPMNPVSSCQCSCGDYMFGPPISCVHPQICVAYCLQMYPGQCSLVNTYGCCGSQCQYFQSQGLDTRYCSCNCAGQQFFNPVDTCVSSQACLTRCLANFPQACIPAATQACCGQDCRSYSQTIADACSCQCRGMTYFPSPRCNNAESCASTCMTTYGDCSADQTVGCCGASCTSYIPTCSCSCGPEFSIRTSVPCQGSRICSETCMNAYGACTQENTQACCGNECLNSFSPCTCMCGSNQYTTLPITCGSAEQCVQACLSTVAQCNVVNARGCCGSECTNFIPTCRCQCGANVYYTATSCRTAEQCTNACISRFGFACNSLNTIGCCNGTHCTRRNRFLGISQAYSTHGTYSNILFFSLSYLVIFYNI